MRRIGNVYAENQLGARTEGAEKDFAVEGGRLVKQHGVVPVEKQRVEIARIATEKFGPDVTVLGNQDLPTQDGFIQDDTRNRGPRCPDE